MRRSPCFSPPYVIFSKTVLESGYKIQRQNESAHGVGSRLGQSLIADCIHGRSAMHGIARIAHLVCSRRPSCCRWGTIQSRHTPAQAPWTSHDGFQTPNPPPLRAATDAQAAPHGPCIGTASHLCHRSSAQKCLLRVERDDIGAAASALPSGEGLTAAAHEGEAIQSEVGSKQATAGRCRHSCEIPHCRHARPVSAYC